MIYQSDKMAYAPVMAFLKGDTGEVFICRDAFAGRGNYYTLFVLRDHGTVRRLIRVMEQSAYGYECCLEIFQQGGVYCAVFPYVKERNLKSFYMPNRISLETRGKVCENLILACMLSKFPYPLLYLALEQEQIHLRKDYSVELGCTVDLDDLDENIGEKECVRQCAVLLRELLKNGKGRENMAYQFFAKKWGYETFGELYRDMRLVKRTMKKQRVFTRLRLLFQCHREGMARTLRLVCMGLIILTLACLLYRAVWGEIPFSRFWNNPFKVIGTESLAGEMRRFGCCMPGSGMMGRWIWMRS